MAIGVIQVQAAGDWAYCVALKEERKLRGWIYFEDGNNRIVCISGKGKVRGIWPGQCEGWSYYSLRWQTMGSVGLVVSRNSSQAMWSLRYLVSI